jgi:hypothetical protein
MLFALKKRQTNKQNELLLHQITSINHNNSDVNGQRQTHVFAHCCTSNAHYKLTSIETQANAVYSMNSYE